MPVGNSPVVEHPLRNRAYRQLWAGGTISSIGDQFYFVALPWLVLQLTGSSITLGTITMAAAIPRAALMLFGGALTDRISPRRIMMTTALSRALLVAAISVLLWEHSLKLWALYALALGFGTADAFAIPAAQSFLPSIVAREQLAAANSLSQSTAQLTTMVAPAPAGLFLKAFGAAWAFFIDAVSFLFILVALWRLPDPVKPAASGAARKNMLKSIAEGVRYANKDTALRSLMLVLAVLNFAIAGPAGIGIAYLAKQEFGSATTFGLLMSALAAGGLAGSILAGLTKQRKRGLWMLGLCVAIGLCLAAFGMVHSLAAMAAILALIGGSSAFVNVQLIAWFQQRIEPAMMGRVMSLLMFSSVGLMPFSLAIAGFAIRWSASGTFLAAGAMVLLVTLLGAMSKPVREID
ncbi:MFS transporter [Silvibacterium acidisoli]|uniref:MFS transporter n=1 Tax=Acidobacteriaceae bacterium ZG23-2 TaxID=2883246 RepID=UPI00406C8D9D